MAGLYRAKRTFAVGRRVVRKGTVVVGGEDAAVDRFPDLFDRIGTADAPAEQATARPGEKRSTRRKDD